MVLSNKLIYGKNGFLEKRITNDMGECVTTYTYNEAGFLTSDHLSANTRRWEPTSRRRWM